jgi:tRNA-splicing ligase RtcB
MPAWSSFREAARAEKAARDAAINTQAAAVNRPQPAEFQNSPLRVFGEHSNATLAQMRACMAVGNAVAGVICADGHLGYAQPVGGVIAYEKQISISGVGFDIGCGNMAVRLDTPYADIAGRVPDILADIRRVISFGVGATTRSASSMSCSIMATPGAKLTWRNIVRKRHTSWAPWAPAIITST